MKKFILVSILSFGFNSVFALAPKAEVARFKFIYKVEVAKPKYRFSKLRIWIPVPSESNFQKIVNTTISTSLQYKINQENKSGNKMLFVEIASPEKLPATIEATYEISREAATPVTLNQMKNGEYWNPKDLLSSDEKIPINGQIAEIAAMQTSGLRTQEEKIRKIYKYVTDSMTYNKDGTGWGQGDAVWACNSKRGNCTDFHSFLIGMARSQKIPARFEIGFPIPPESGGPISGYHCWAWVFSDEDKTWLPLDSSEAKKAGKLFEYLGYIPNDRIQFTNGRDIILSPKQEGPSLNYFIYPYMEVDGRSSLEFKKEFSFKRL